MRTSAAALLIVLVTVSGARAAEESACSVRYLSAEHVYLDAGRLAGLEEGLAARVVRDDTLVADLEVVYAADRSASCTVVQAAGEIRTGDRVLFVPAEGTAPVAVVATPPPRQRELRPPATRTERATTPGPRFTGHAALRWDYAGAGGGSDVSSTVWTLPFRVRARDLGGGWEFRSRGSVRRILRDGGGSTRPDQEWRNRIHELALVRDGRRANWHLAVGRIGTRAAAAAGPFDGLAVDGRVTGGLRLGGFAGWAPAWGDMNFSTAEEVVGLTAQLVPSGSNTGFGMLLSGIGRYHEGEISREWLAMTTTWRGGGGVSLLQAAELDFNRGWKKDTGGDAVRLTSLALVGRWQVSRGLALSAGYDDREPVRTWETRDRPDSLFQDAGRRGLRGSVHFRDGRNRRVDLAAAVRSPSGAGGDTKSWSARVWSPSWPLNGIDLDLAVRGFEGPLLDGIAPRFGVSGRRPGGWYLRGAGGMYSYGDRLGGDDRTSTWLSGGVEKDLGRHWSALGEVRADWGDATDRTGFALEARYRF